MSSTSPGIHGEPAPSQDRRAVGHRRVRAATGWSAAGGTALAILFGVVFAGSAPSPAAAAPADAPDPSAGTGVAPPASAQDAGAQDGGAQDRGAQVTGTSTAAAAPTAKHHRHVAAPVPAPRLAPPAQAPQPAPPSRSRHHAASGAS